MYNKVDMRNPGNEMQEKYNMTEWEIMNFIKFYLRDVLNVNI